MAMPLPPATCAISVSAHKIEHLGLSSAVQSDLDNHAIPIAMRYYTIMSIGRQCVTEDTRRARIPVGARNDKRKQWAQTFGPSFGSSHRPGNA
jgi:hypothetical protein